MKCRLLITKFFLLLYGWNGLIAQGLPDPTLTSDTLDPSLYHIRKSKEFLGTQNDSALFFSNLALTEAEMANDPSLVALARHQKAIVHRELGEWKLAIENVAVAIDIFLKNQQKVKACQAYLSLGNIYTSEGDILERSSNFDASAASYALALKYYQKALFEAECVNDTISVAHSYLNIGAAHYKLFNDKEALKNLKLSARLFTRVGENVFLSKVMSNIGLIYESFGKMDSAIYCHQLARKSFIGAGNYKNWIGTNINLAGIYHQTNNPEAIALLEEADSISTLTKNSVQKALVQEHLYAIHARDNNYKKALSHLENYITIKDSLLNVEFKTEELNVRYETAKQKELIERQKAENLQKELQLAQSEAQRSRLIWLGSILTLGIIVAFITYYWRQRLKSIIRKQKEKLQQQRILELERSRKLEAASAMLAGQEKERIRIAEDLHDRLGSTLAAARMQFEAATGKSSIAFNHLTKGQDLLDRAIKDTRNISHNLISGVLVKLGLLAALKDLKESLEVNDRLQVKLIIDDNIPPLDSNIELQIFRITQELVSNVIRHSDATKLNIQLIIRHRKLKLIVEDNGKGFEQEQVKHGLGLQNMQRRVASLDGLFQIITKPGKGSRFIIQLEIPHEEVKTHTG